MRNWMVTALALGAIACDADKDGLTNGWETQNGTDPKVSDSDGDGIDDGTELYEHGTDPALADSDGDGFDDGVEISLGVDPLDGNDAPYRGGWPMLPAEVKAEVADGPAEGPNVGDRFPRLKLNDQHKDRVDLYDFAREGKPIILDISAEWCGPCQMVAMVLEGEQVPGMEYAYPAYDLVQNGDVRWITIMGEDSSGAYATWRTSKSWSRAYPNELIAVLADEAGEAVSAAQLPYWPYILIVDENFVVTATGDAAWDAIASM